MSDEIVSTKYAAHLCGVSLTYFQQLAKQPNPVEPIRVKGSGALCWTQAQIAEVRSRVKRHTTATK
jgi:hypothetical protein